jgi:hypothetical protein
MEVKHSQMDDEMSGKYSSAGTIGNQDLSHQQSLSQHITQRQHVDFDKYCYVFPGIVALFLFYLFIKLMSDESFNAFVSSSIGWPILILGPGLAYLFCPCTCGRESFRLFSWGSLGAAIGFLIGMPITILLIIYVEPYAFLVSIPFSTCAFSYLFHWSYHRRKKNISRRVE